MQESSASSPHDVCYEGGQHHQEYAEKDDCTRLLKKTAWQTTQAQRLSYAKELQCRKQHSIIPPSTSRWRLVSKMAKSVTMHATACCSKHKT